MSFPKSRTTPASQAEPDRKPETGTPGTVRVQKREAGAPALREKLCATCGRPFKLKPDEKFFDCPACYQKNQPPRRSRKQGEAQVLVQITCAQCGTQEFVGFTPTDPAAALCRTCFSAQKREQKLASPHPKPKPRPKHR